MVARDPSSFAGSCTSASYARWYLHQAQPYFGGAESTVADFDPRSGPAASRCGTLGTVSLHWLAPPPSLTPSPLAVTYRCPYSTDATRVFSSQIVVNPNPLAAGTLDAAAATCARGPYTSFTAGPGDANNDAPQCRSYDLMSLLAHEVGHVIGLDHDRMDAAGQNSVDPVCLNGSEVEDPRLDNNTNREICVPAPAPSVSAPPNSTRRTPSGSCTLPPGRRRPLARLPSPPSPAAREPGPSASPGTPPEPRAST